MKSKLRVALETLIPFARECWDEGPPEEGWQSDELVAAIKLAEEALKSEEA